ncbi:hypothetical protein HCO57_07265 [Croceivirga sp. JEA036]|nr:hypothetical protein [Croceivirga sp. JEA036]
MPFKSVLNAIQVEIWQNHIEEELFKDNTFLRFSHNADANVINSKVVHIPQSAGSGNVVKNRSTVPASVRKRNDTDVIYLLDEFTTDPVYIPHADTKELSYDKRASALGEDRDKLVEVVAEETIYNWLNSGAHGTYAASSFPAANILATTGADVANGATAPNATGARKAFSINDLQRAQTYFRQNKRWFNDKMYAMLPPDMLAQAFPADSQVTATYMQNVTEEERRMGVILKAQGWKILSRSTVTSVTAANAVNPVGAAGAATDDNCALFWYSEAVEFAFGGVEAFENIGDPQYYGDIYSFLVRSGGRARRADYNGIMLMKQAKTA